MSFNNNSVKLRPKKISHIGWQKNFMCLYCGKGPFKLCKEIGQLNCDFHSKKWSKKHKKYKCCNNKDKYSKGCLLRDHNSKMYNNENWYVFNKDELVYVIKNIGDIKDFHPDAKIDKKEIEVVNYDNLLTKKPDVSATKTMSYFCIRRNNYIEKKNFKKKFKNFLVHEKSHS
jgi:hypothetical protein